MHISNEKPLSNLRKSGKQVYQRHHPQIHTAHGTMSPTEKTKEENIICDEL